jgi:2-amino-4-hydroxy-6-hydroxymethyldihydropteridine diphosphokinase
MRESVPVVFGIGSNIAPKRLNIRRAVHELTKRFNVVRVSSLFETSPIGVRSGDEAFYNAAVLALTRHTPDKTLQLVNEIESLLGRRRSYPNAPRTVDIDIILFGAEVRRSRELVIPHPRYRSREFVLAPMREIVREWVDPQTSVRIDWLRGEGEAVRLGRIY